MIRRYASDALKKRSVGLVPSRHSWSSSSSQPIPIPLPAAPPSPADVATSPPPDPYTLLAHQLTHVREKLTSLLSSSKAHAGLTDIAQFYFLHPSTQLRSLVVLLFAHATNGLGRGWAAKLQQQHQHQHQHGQENRRAMVPDTDTNTTTHDPLTRSDVLNDWHPSYPDLVPLSQPVSPSHIPPPSIISSPTNTTTTTTTTRPPPTLLASPPLILSTQLQLAQIVEMIHIASLLHYDVSDIPNARGDTKPSAFGDNLSILGGDFLLGRASAAVSRLGDSRVVELTAGIIANIAEGEVLHTRRMPGSPTCSTVSLDDAWNLYLQKTYLKTASLMAKGARASIILGGGAEGEVWTEVAYVYGRNLGLASQLLEDILEYESTLGTPHPHFCTVTGPVLYAWKAHPEIGPLLSRGFGLDGDLEIVRDYVQRSSGVERTGDLARQYADKAKDVLQLLPDSDAKLALEVLANRILERTW